MNAEFREAARLWLNKAQNDRKAFEILAADDEASTDTVCFHCQQYVEKLLKAEMREMIALAEQFGRVLVPRLEG
jgi:HEPN domain-containing protein